MAEELEVTRVLVVTAHPDDVDFGAAGTIATWTAQGIDVSYCIVTDGDAGGFRPGCAPRPDRHRRGRSLRGVPRRTEKALLSHVSQHPSPDGLEDRMRGWPRASG